MASLLKDRDIASQVVDLSDIIHYDGTPRLDVAFYRESALRFRARIQECEYRLPIVTGFFGNVPGGLLDGVVGRGYTDLCAALVAVGIKAIELQRLSII